ncbi:helix-turn-helix domain-containing protein [Paenibacillus aurantiacus]|uniref:Helix-turn-helix domain-containing protein n=1 Tax=Paenibacillus aurantiacus TaxID=1936118 RepID=A0ABV5KRE4_9BACL
MSTFGERLKKLRERKKLSQKELAERFNLSQSTIAYYETNKKQPSQSTLQKFADFYETSVDYLLGRVLENTDTGAREQSTDFDANVGRAFFGGADKYTEEELDIARAAAKAAVEAYRKGKQQRGK